MYRYFVLHLYNLHTFRLQQTQPFAQCADEIGLLRIEQTPAQRVGQRDQFPILNYIYHNRELRMKNKKTIQVFRFMLLPLATTLYVYGIVSLATFVTILSICALRGDWVILGEVTFAKALTVIIGIIVLFPAKTFRAHMLKN